LFVILHSLANILVTILSGIPAKLILNWIFNIAMIRYVRELIVYVLNTT
jgi:hypothetical protein